VVVVGDEGKGREIVKVNIMKKMCWKYLQVLEVIKK